jgi:hypothetical protein
MSNLTPLTSSSGHFRNSAHAQNFFLPGTDCEGNNGMPDRAIFATASNVELFLSAVLMSRMPGVLAKPSAILRTFQVGDKQQRHDLE